MPENFWTDINEIRALAWLATSHKITFSLRGSVAQSLADLYISGRSFHSLFEIVAPFADLDFLVDSHSTGQILQSALANELPSSRFFRIDVVTPEELERYRNSNLVIEGVPRVVFNSRAYTTFDLAFASTPDGEVTVMKGLDAYTPTVKRGEGGIDLANAVNDIAYVARRFPRLLQSEELVALRNALREGYRAAAESTRGPKARRLLFTLTKLLLAQATRKPNMFLEWLDDPVWSELERSKNQRLVELVELLRKNARRVTVAAVPRRKNNVWRSEIDRIVEAKSGAVNVAIGADAMATPGAVRARMPPVRVVTDEPERPGCCQYRDFSRGVVEIGWTGPNQPLDSPSLPLTMIGSGDDVFLAPSLTSSDGVQHATRIDYGFICQLTGEAKAIDIHPAGADDVE